jgi:hypothetical protein
MLPARLYIQATAAFHFDKRLHTAHGDGFNFLIEQSGGSP